jgi:hypothetical protein
LIRSKRVLGRFFGWRSRLPVSFAVIERDRASGEKIFGENLELTGKGRTAESDFFKMKFRTQVQIKIVKTT